MTDTKGVFAEIHELVISKRITTYARIISLCVTLTMVLLGYGPLFQSDSRAYDNPVFDGVFAFASPEAWGIGFMVPASILFIGALSSRAIIYLTGSVVAAVTLAGWASMVMLEAWLSEEAVLTAGAIGLYVGTFTMIVGLAASPNQIVKAKPVIAIVEEGEPPVLLRQIG